MQFEAPGAVAEPFFPDLSLSVPPTSPSWTVFFLLDKRRLLLNKDDPPLE